MSSSSVLSTLLTSNLPFQLDDITLKYTDSEEVPDNVKEDCCPGAPHILLYADSKPVLLKVINTVPQNGLFSLIININECPSVEKLVDKLKKELKLGKGTALRCSSSVIKYSWRKLISSLFTSLQCRYECGNLALQRSDSRT